MAERDRPRQAWQAFLRPPDLSTQPAPQDFWALSPPYRVTVPLSPNLSFSPYARAQLEAGRQACNAGMQAARPGQASQLQWALLASPQASNIAEIFFTHIKDTYFKLLYAIDMHAKVACTCNK